MGLKLVSVAIMAAVLGAASAEAQSVGKLGGPANPPPPGFTGQQFVDSRGCVFLKAGYGGQTSWVPRVGRDHKALCGFPPTGSVGKIEVATAAEEAAPAPAPAPEPVVVAQPEPAAVAVAPAPVMVAEAPKAMPAPVVAPAPTYAPVVTVQAPAPYVEQAPVSTYEVVEAGPGPGQIGCYTSAPVAQRVKLRNGGTAVVCTRGDGTMTGWRPPVYPRSAGVGASLSYPVQVARGTAVGNGGYLGAAEDYAATEPAVPKPPKGYKMAWKDDRLNPMRGKGTASGWADQSQVWTDEVPAKLVADQPVTKRKTKVVYSTKNQPQKAGKVTMSTKGHSVDEVTAPKKAAKAAAGGAYVQVGTFGVPSNAEGAAARLSGMGLPVARAKITSGGKPMQIVLAGPFGSAADAQAALSMARGAGFGDAFIR